MPRNLTSDDVINVNNLSSSPAVSENDVILRWVPSENKFCKTTVRELTSKISPVYGTDYDLSTKKSTRALSAAGLKAGYYDGGQGSIELTEDNDFDHLQPWSDIDSCLVKADGTVPFRFSEDPAVYQAAYQAGYTLNGVFHHYEEFVYVPGFYYADYIESGVEKFRVSMASFSNAFYFSPKYISKYLLSSSGQYNPVSNGDIPWTRISPVEMAQYILDKADGKFTPMSAEDMAALRALFVVEFGSATVQAPMQTPGKVYGSGVYTTDNQIIRSESNTNTVVIYTNRASNFKVGDFVCVAAPSATNPLVGNSLVTPRQIQSITMFAENPNQRAIRLSGSAFTVEQYSVLYCIPQPILPQAAVSWSEAEYNYKYRTGNGSGYIFYSDTSMPNYATVPYRCSLRYRGIFDFFGNAKQALAGVEMGDSTFYQNTQDPRSFVVDPSASSDWSPVKTGLVLNDGYAVNFTPVNSITWAPIWVPSESSYYITSGYNARCYGLSPSYSGPRVLTTGGSLYDQAASSPFTFDASISMSSDQTAYGLVYSPWVAYRSVLGV